MNLVKVVYEASSGNRYDLKCNGLRIRAGANFHKYGWEYDSTALQYGVKVERFTKKPKEYETTLVLTGTYLENDALLRKMHEDFERDILNKSTGKLWWGKCYIECYITDSSTHPDDDNVMVENDITILCPYPFWIEEESFTIEAVEQEVEGTGKEYPYTYPYTYGRSASGRTVLNTEHYAPSNFRLTAYGPTASVYVTIAGHVYSVDYPVAEGERLVIDSRETRPTTRRVYIIHADGSEGNVFNYRSQASSVFEKIPSGRVNVDYTRAYKLVLTLYKERSEPVWN